MKPTKGPLSELTDDEFDEFIVRLGFLCFRTPAGSAFARHRSPLSTVADYLDIYPDDPKVGRLAATFWKDFCARKLSTDEICLKWYGLNAQDLAGEVSKGLAKKLSEGGKEGKP